MAPVSELIEFRSLFTNLTLRELRTKYKRSVMGWAWSLVNPLVTMTILAIVFRFVLKVQPETGNPSGLRNFAFFLLCGLVPWNFLTAGLVGGVGAPVANSSLVKKVYFPRELLTASVVASWAVQCLIELGVLSVALLGVGNMILKFLPGVILVLGLESLFIYGVALGLGSVNVYLRDVQHLVTLLLQVWFYATPVVYPASLVPRVANIHGVVVPFRTLYRLNPMVRFVEMFRDLLYHLRWPPAGDVAYLSLITAAAFLAGRTLFLRLEPRFADEL